MTSLAALVPPAVCAAALGRAWPADLDGQVRCLDEGTRSLSLAFCCAPWSVEADDVVLRADLGLGAPTTADGFSLRHSGEGRNPLPPFPAFTLPSTAESLGALSRPGGEVAGETFERIDAVVSALADTPGAPPVLGVVSGPLGWAGRLTSNTEAVAHVDDAGQVADMDLGCREAIDAAADLAAERVRTMAELGVRRIAVVESGPPGLLADRALAAEVHAPLINAASHLRLELVLISTDPTGSTRHSGVPPRHSGVPPRHSGEGRNPDAAASATRVTAPTSAGSVHAIPEADRLGYDRWVGPDNCSDGLAFVPADAFASHQSVTDCISHFRSRLASSDTVVTVPLDPDTDPDVVRFAAALIAGRGREHGQ